MATAEFLIDFGRYWLYVGLVVAAIFLAFGLEKVDPDTRGAYVFRALLIPGLVLIWPVVLWRWSAVAKGEPAFMGRHRPPRAAHGKVWSVLAALIPLVLLIALVLNEPATPAFEPVRLSGPGG